MARVPQRFYDIILKYGLGEVPKRFPEDQLPEIEKTRASLLDNPVVVAADNVVRYFEENEAGFSYDFARDCPNLAPPFEGGFFIETSNPGILDTRQGQTKAEGPGGRYWGIYLESFDFTRQLGEGYEEEATRNTLELGEEAERGTDSNRAAGGLEIAPRWHLSYSLFMSTPQGLKAIGPVSGGLLAVAPDGGVCRWADGNYINLSIRYGSDGTDEDSARLGARLFKDLCFPLFLAVSFAHCKNVTLEEVLPADMRSKKARKKKPAGGAKRGVRHHTLQIEPMKEVLRTEGNVEEQGLKRALHITRGHFKHYTPERGGLFGRPIDEPETVWVSQHVRGKASTKKVEKDYQIDSPSSQPSWGSPERRSTQRRSPGGSS